MIADQSDKDNWILSEFLDKLEQQTIPFYPIILGSKEGKIEELPSGKEVIIINEIPYQVNKSSLIEELPNQLSPPATTPEAGKKKFIKKLEELLKS